MLYIGIYKDLQVEHNVIVNLTWNCAACNFRLSVFFILVLSVYCIAFSVLHCIQCIALHSVYCIAFSVLHCIQCIALHSVYCTAFSVLHCIQCIVLHLVYHLLAIFHITKHFYLLKQILIIFLSSRS